MTNHTELLAALAEAAAFFVGSEDGEDRDSMASFWTDVAFCAAIGGAPRVRAYVAAMTAFAAAIAADDEAALDAADRAVSAALGHDATS